MDCTLIVNMILEDGQHYPRGSVLDMDLLPAHLKSKEYIVKGAVSINRVMPIDMVEIGDEIKETSMDKVASPMKELEIEEIDEVKPKKPLLKRRR